MNKKNRAFSMVEIIVSLLFVSIMVIIGLKFILTDKKISTESAKYDALTLILSNEIELYNNNTNNKITGELKNLYNIEGIKIDDKLGIENSELAYVSELRSEKIYENLDLLIIKIKNSKTGEVLCERNQKVYRK